MSEKIAGVPADMREEAEAAAAQRAQAEIDAQEAARAAAVRRIADQRAMEAVADKAREPVPAPTPAPKAPTNADARRMLDEAEEIRARAESERARLEQLGNDYETRLRREMDRDRVASLRTMGVIGAVTDEQLLLIAPNVDAESVQGKAKLDEWRQANLDLFVRPSAPTIPTPDELIASLPRKSSDHGFFGPEYFAEIFKRNMVNK